MSYDEIQNAFLEGMNEVYTTIFTDTLMFELLESTQSKINTVYKETLSREYQDPISLSGNVLVRAHEGEIVVEDTKFFTEISIPTKQLIDNEIPFETKSDLKKLEGGRFTYKGVSYLVDEVIPKVLIANIFQIYQFKCIEETENTLGRA